MLSPFPSLDSAPEPEVDPRRSIAGDHRLIFKLQTLSFHGNESNALTCQATSIADHFVAAGVRLWSWCQESNVLKLRGAVGVDVPFDGLQDDVPVDQSELGTVVSTGTAVAIDCTSDATPDEVRMWAASFGVSNFYVLPILTDARTWGVLGVFTSAPLTPGRRVFLSTVAQALGSGIANAGDPAPLSVGADLISSIVPCLNSAVILLDEEGLITSWNSAAESLFGWSESAVLGKPLPIIPESRQQEFTNVDGSPLVVQRMMRSHTECLSSRQLTIPVQRTVAPLLNQSGDCLGRVEILSDDSPRVRTSRCLEVQRSVARILAGSRSIEEAVSPLLTRLGEWLGCDVVECWVHDRNGDGLSRAGVWARDINVRNRVTATELRLKSNSDEWMTQTMRDGKMRYSTNAAGPTVQAAFPAHATLKAQVAGVVIPVTRDNETLGMITCLGLDLPETDDLTNQTLEFIANTLGQFLFRIEAEAALAESEANLRQSQKMDAIGLLAGGVAHDFNNLLTVILAYSELGVDEVEAGHPHEEFFQEIHGAGERASAMTQQLLAVSRQQPAQITNCNLNQLVDELHKMLQRLVGPEIPIRRDCEPTLSNIQADVNQLQQVLLNLVVNARDAMPDGGTITITTSNVTLKRSAVEKHGIEAGPFVQLDVADSGCGMDEQTLTRIFEPFFTTKEVGKGTGMGLSTVFGIVRQAGGFIDVSSKVGEGTTFSVFLPKSKEVLKVDTISEQPATTLTGTETILVVDSDDSVRSLVRRLLEVRGYTVIDTSDGGEAVRILDQRKPVIDLLLTDLCTPTVSGAALVKTVMSQKQCSRFLLMSGNAEPPVDLLENGSRQYLQKPFTSTELARLVRIALDTPTTR